ncbi:MAG: enoyl-CoA hydratase [Bacillus sp. (in: firmicutes)]
MVTRTDLVSGVEPVIIHRNGRVATVELNRPKAMNALDIKTLKMLGKKLKEISIEDEIDIVLLKGAGKAFSAGGDVKMMAQMNDEKEFYPVMDAITDLSLTLYCMPKLTITAIQGAAAGLGLSLALASDYIIADKDAKIAMNFIGIGLIPDGGAHFFLSQRIGDIKTKELIWEGKVMQADEALARELIQEVADGDLEQAVENKINAWLQSPTKAMIRTKKILAERNRPNLLKMLELEKHGQSKMRRTNDHKEGVSAFIEKRKPNFQGN